MRASEKTLEQARLLASSSKIAAGLLSAEEALAGNLSRLTDGTFRKAFRNDEEYLKWIECRNTDLNQEMNRMQLKLQQMSDENRSLQEYADSVRRD